MADLGHIAETSRVRIAVDASRFPLSPALRASWGDSDAAVIRAATAGDDYELAFTCARADAQRIRKVARAVGVVVTECGVVMRGQGVVLVDSKRRPHVLSRAGYTHF